MGMKGNKPMDPLAKLAARFAAAVAIATAGMAYGQHGGRGHHGGPQPAPQATPPSSTSFGVKAKIPGPIGISRKGTLLNRTGTLLPPAPTVSRSGGGSGYGYGYPARPRPHHTYPTARPDLDGRPIHIGPGYVGNPGHITSGTGVVIDGKARGDHWNLRFHLGSGYTYSPWWKPWQYPNYRWNDYYYPAYYGNWIYPSYGYSSSSYSTPLVYGQPDPYVISGINPAAVYAAALSAQAAQTAQPPREPTPLEKADALLLYGEPKASAEAYRKYLEDAPDDASAMRSLAIALLQLRRFDEAVAVMAMAYDKQPRLARTPIDPAFFGDAAGLRKSLNSAVNYANRVNSGSAWLLVAALMQAEGRDDVALRMTERARAAGLAEPVATQLADVLRRN